MRQQATAARNGIIVAHGYGLKIRGDRQHLIIEDGTGPHRRIRRLHRVTSRLTRLILNGHTGYITLDALRWIHDIGAALLHIDADGQLLTTSTRSGPDLAPLRRAQALAPNNSTGLEIARSLLRAKIAGQASLLPELPAAPQAGIDFEHAQQQAAAAKDLPTLLSAEAQAASIYWKAWAQLSNPIAAQDQDEVPAHWLTFGQRHSILTDSPRLAVNPANAVLNYLYALLEAESILACHVVGLDPGLGIFHTDRRDRASLALDLLEPVRPTADALLLALLTQRTLGKTDFAETRRGACRITPRLAATLAQTTPTWRSALAPIAQCVAQQLAHDPDARPGEYPTFSRAARPGLGGRDPGHPAAPRRSVGLSLPSTCSDCGDELPNRRQRYCQPCRERRFIENGTQAREQAAATLTALRAEQRDPAHGGRAAELRGRKNAAHQRAVQAWTGGPADPEQFRSEIQPALRYLPVELLVNATGLSPHYCSMIRLGKRVPHPRHWANLGQLADPGTIQRLVADCNRQPRTLCSDETVQ
jgi:CRISPR-associated endonuclease Cas1